MTDTPTTAVIDPPAWDREDPVPTTAILVRDENRVTPLDPDEPDEAWTERVLAACAPRRRVLGIRD